MKKKKKRKGKKERKKNWFIYQWESGSKILLESSEENRNLPI